MNTKEELRKRFSEEYQTHYQLHALTDRGFSRHTCTKCGRGFWSLRPAPLCAECQTPQYRPSTSIDYIDTWKKFEQFFVKNGHASIPRYPVICRWRDDLHFTIASIVDFMRLEGNNIVWEYPANPLVVPQMCLRFNDIQNVGKTGRHFTSFIMAGQHAFDYPKRGYWKEECIDLNYRFLTEVARIPPEKLIYMEDVWAMPDMSSFGPSLETHVDGVELVNSVFTEFKTVGGVVKEYEGKVIDVGWGFERIVWYMGGGDNAYQHCFGDVSKIFSHATTEEEKQALFAIADHTRTLLFAITDGALPSNVGGGYNLRIVLRRAQNFIERFNFPFTLTDVMEQHARYLRPLFPELSENFSEIQEIMDNEVKRYRETIEKNQRLIDSVIAKQSRISVEDMVKLYESYGITAETIVNVASKRGKTVEIPENFYEVLTDRHLFADTAEKPSFEPEGFPPTKPLYYDDCESGEATVIGIQHGAVVLDQTVFYPEGGGQASDQGTISVAGKQYTVIHAEKVGGVIFHIIDGSHDMKVGDRVHMSVDAYRRMIIRRHHTATHLIGGVCRKVLGNHVWQAGARKTAEKAHLDITHFERIPDATLQHIERMANQFVSRGIPVEITVMERGDAEQKYGFVLYQGGGSPGKHVRVVHVKGIDVEACAGLHVKNTQEIGIIKIIKQERIQDGIVRLTFVVSERVLDYLHHQEALLRNASAVLSVSPEQLPASVERFFREWKERGKEIDTLTELLAHSTAEIVEKKFSTTPLIEERMDLPGDILQKIAKTIVTKDPRRAVILFNDHEMIVACGAESAHDAHVLLKERISKYNGKGGGTKEFARGRW